VIVEVLMVVRAYSPFDPVDKDYRRAHPIPITARGNICSEHPYGIAGDLSAYPRGTNITVPGYGTLQVDDTGGDIRRAQIKWIEVRFPTHKEAKEWGVRTLIVKVRYP
jgi:3D (Asp-Asp-Asp) domain-containing protein